MHAMRGICLLAEVLIAICLGTSASVLVRTQPSSPCDSGCY